MADPRLELLKQMRALRARIDPKIMERVKWSYLGKVPINRDAAQSAVGHFLADRDDGGALRRRLEAALAADGIAVDLDARDVPTDDEIAAETAAPVPEQAAAPDTTGYNRSGHPLKPRRIGRLA